MINTSLRCREGNLHLIKIPPKYKQQVLKIAKKSLTEAIELFKYEKSVETVIFASSPEFVIPETGIGAHALLQGDIVINIDFSRKDALSVIQKELASTIYHEFSHVVRQSVNKKLFDNLFESLIAEGIASYIEATLFSKNVPYVSPIKNEKKYWIGAQKDFNNSKYDHYEWFFGTKKLPRWIGYRLGYLLINSFTEKNKLSISKLTRIKSSEVLKHFHEIFLPN